MTNQSSVIRLSFLSGPFVDPWLAVRVGDCVEHVECKLLICFWKTVQFDVIRTGVRMKSCILPAYAPPYRVEVWCTLTLSGQIMMQASSALLSMKF